MSLPESEGTGDALPPLQPGETIGRYELLEPLSTGAVGDLWKGRIATGPEVGRTVTVRRIRRSGVLDVGAVVRLTNAGFAAMELRHPKIAAVLDFVIADAEMAVVSEQIPGAPLAAVLRPPPGTTVPRLPVGAAVRIALDVLEALDGVAPAWAEIVPDPQTDDEWQLRAGIHGGVAPEVILVAGFGETMLLEVGVTGVAFRVPVLGEHQDALAYRAPELLDGKTLPDARADVFTVGALLWELVAGRPLFGAAAAPRKSASDPAQVAALKRKIQSATVQRLDAMPLLGSKVSRELADFVARALSRDPGARFQTIRDAIVALSHAPVAGARDHAAVAEWVRSAGLAEGAATGEPYRATLESNRPTLPPVEDRSQFDTLPPLEELPPDEPAASRADTVPRGAGAAPVAPSAKGPAARAMSSPLGGADVAPPSEESAFAGVADLQRPAPPSFPLPSIGSGDAERAPASFGAPKATAVPSADSEASLFGVPAPSRPARAGSGKWVVLMGAGGAIAVAVLAVLALSGPDEKASTGAASGAGPARPARANDDAVEPATKRAATEALPSGALDAGAAAPTSAPQVVSPAPAMSATQDLPKKLLPRKAPFRPTGI